MAGYHIREIENGVFGQFSKIKEEFDEFLDALDQNCTLMALLELSDLLGALEGYCLKKNISFTDLISKSVEAAAVVHPERKTDLHFRFSQITQATSQEEVIARLEDFLVDVVLYVETFNLRMLDLLTMSKITQRAFISGHRTPKE